MKRRLLGRGWLEPPREAWSSAPEYPCPAPHTSLLQGVSPDQPAQGPCPCPTCSSLSSQLRGWNWNFPWADSSPSPASCPVPLTVLLIFFSLALSHRPLSSSLPWMWTSLQLVIHKDLQKLGDDLVKTPCRVEHEVA